ncbi:hypothetical protein Acr_17g0008800 [Actinidia rufa]|uniref:Integrase catalytic domain-containing protein n=1 Tax=Actinidia rufa TaxID=165716 RepID=A0A7J0G3G5_9ERIC|nr:hypothetical protein Acr_17g0008800 [Actinidia rufa]
MKVIEEEVAKLIKANVIRESHYSDWLANFVVASKKGKKWRVCVNFTDLNTACPKDSFPLPKIDLIVDTTSKHELLSFMDAFSRYHQIKMHPPDLEKTSVITERGLHCYKVMPFGLKNAGVTYQRLVNKMFKDLIGKAMEVYINNMLVKILKIADHITHLEEAFGVLRKHQMMLNPSKCLFGVSSGKFSKILVTKRGIKVNPNKIQALLAMSSPRNTHKVQQLIERIAALNRFVSKLAENCLPFFKILRKNQTFRWNEESETAFQQLKKFKAKNNEVEYEALLASLRIVAELGVNSLDVFSDNQLVVNQVQGDYLAKDTRMVAYLDEVKTMSRKIRDFKIRQIPREEYKKADALANLASTFDFILDRCIPLEFLANPSIKVAKSVFQAEQGLTWMNKVFMYLQDGTLLQDKLQAHCIQYKSARFCILNGILYKKSFSGPLLRCLQLEEGEYVMKEIHEGICGNHSRARFGILKVIILDNARQFDNDKFKIFCSDLAISHHFSSPSYPQVNGQVEVTNRTILKNLKAMFKKLKSEWIEDLPSILWAYHTTSRIPTGKTPYSMVFKTESIIPVEIGMASFRTSNIDKRNNEIELRLNLNLLDEKREQAEIRQVAYKHQVALSTKEPNTKKLGPTWEGSYKVTKVSRPRTYWLKDMEGKALLHPWNAEHFEEVLSVRRLVAMRTRSLPSWHH